MDAGGSPPADDGVLHQRRRLGFRAHGGADARGRRSRRQDLRLCLLRCWYHRFWAAGLGACLREHVLCRWHPRRGAHRARLRRHRHLLAADGLPALASGCGDPQVRDLPRAGARRRVHDGRGCRNPLEQHTGCPARVPLCGLPALHLQRRQRHLRGCWRILRPLLHHRRVHPVHARLAAPPPGKGGGEAEGGRCARPDIRYSFTSEDTRHHGEARPWNDPRAIRSSLCRLPG
mmetsp:Transcript_64093/g.198486  ORF Transcript_64093/g.198486 Transcript_64093/m.198486 type:complete len:232 (-) Transcript_64093:441-1136(-)